MSNETVFPNGIISPSIVTDAITIDALTFNTSGGEINFNNNTIINANLKIPENVIINGDFQVAQRGSSWSEVASGIYPADRWKFTSGGSLSATWDINISSDVPSVSASGENFMTSLLFSTHTDVNAIDSTSYAYVSQKIEGYKYRLLRGKPMTLSFWSKVTIGRNIGVFIKDVANSVYFVHPFVYATSDDWIFYKINIPAPTIGTWTTDNTGSLEVGFTFWCGSGHLDITNLDVWHSGSDIFAGNGAQIGLTSGEYASITGVSLVPGDYAYPYQHESYTEVLKKCKRYLCKIQHDTCYGEGAIYSLPTGTTSTFQIFLSLPEQMAKYPTLETSTVGTGAGDTFRVWNVGYDPGYTPSEFYVNSITLLGSSLSLANLSINVAGYGDHWIPGIDTAYLRDHGDASYLLFNAEL